MQTGRTATEASTYTGSAGNDTFIMMHANDVLDGGAGTGDTLDINMAQAVGTAIIDLSASDQIATFNGGANAAVQTGFENVDLAGLTLNGAVVTGSSGANEVTGSGLVDQISGEAGADFLKGGAGNDVITGGDGDDYLRGDGGTDTLTGGAGTDVFAFHSSSNGSDTISDWSTSDVIVFGADEDPADDSHIFDGSSTIKLPTTDPSSLTVDSDGNGGYVTVATTDYIEGGVTSVLTTDHVWVLTTAAGYASVTAALNAVDDDGTGSVDDDIEGILVFYNSATSKVEMWDVQEAGTAANNYTDETATQLATFDNVAAADIAASFAATNFGIELIA